MRTFLPTFALLLVGCGGRSHTAPAQTAPGARTTFVIKNLNVKVVEQTPNALQRGAFMGCETFAAWRPELVTPLVSYVEEAKLTAGEHVRNVAVFEQKANDLPGVRAELQPHEFGIAIDPSTLILYDRDRVESYCITIVEKGDILVRLDLFNVMEAHHP